MMPLTRRRIFLANTVKASIGWYLGSAALSSCAARGKASTAIPTRLTTGFSQQPLPYSYTALNEAIDAATMEIHYAKHAASYAANLLEAAKAEGIDTGRPLEEALRHISRYSVKLRNNGGGHYNHELFWKCMTPQNTGGPSGALAMAIDSSFGSLDAFKTQFTEAGKTRFGSGWAWLIVDGDKRLRVGSTANQDNPLMDITDLQGFPLLGLDVWEHAYYLRYQNKRPEYINNWWKVVNWNYVSDRFQSIA